MPLKGRRRSEVRRCPPSGIICEYDLQVQVVFGDKPTHRYGMYEYAHITHTVVIRGHMMVDDTVDEAPTRTIEAQRCDSSSIVRKPYSILRNASPCRCTLSAMPCARSRGRDT